MSLLASQIMDRSAALLNDVAKTQFTYAAQLPYLQIANDELADELTINGIAIFKNVADTLTITVGTTIYSPLPTDLIVPQKLWERPTNQSNEDFVPMEQKTWEPSAKQVDALQYWIWRDNSIIFLGATQSVDVRLDYIRAISAISNSGSTEEVTGSFNFLAYMTASLCAEFIGQNQVVSGKLESKAYKHLSTLLNIGVRENQSLPMRRKPYRIKSNRRYF